MRLGAGFVIVLLLGSTCLQAQRIQYGRLKGTVIDSTENTPLEAATISVFLASDSSLVSYALSGIKGEFAVHDVPRETACWLMVTFNGYNAVIKSFRIPAGKQELDIRAIRINKAYSELGQITVVAHKPPVVIRQDTIEFNVGSFVTRPNGMIEDVLRQMPGVEIESDGTITINGKKVSKVTLDGKEFFGDDPRIATRNLPKDIIDKIQVTDNRSRESRFNKIKTGDEDLAINLTIRKDKNQGWLGMAGAGYGSDKRHEAFANINYFNDGRQLSFLGNANNTNRGNYSGENFDISSSSGTLGGGGQGISTTQSGGLNFNENISSALRMSGSYFINGANNKNVHRLQRQNILPDTTFLYYANSVTNNEHRNHRLVLNSNYNPDSLTEIHLAVSVNIDNTEMSAGNDAISIGGSGALINSSVNNFASHSGGWSGSGNIFIGKRFSKEGRSISTTVNFDYNHQPVREENKGENIFFDDNNETREWIDQRSDVSNKGKGISISLSYNEPMGEDVTLSLQHNYFNNRNKSDKQTNRFNPVTGNYDITDSLFTNAFINSTETHYPKLQLQFRRNKLRWSLGAGLQYITQDNMSTDESATIKQHHANFAPSANIGYNFSKTFNIDLYYTGRSQQPSIMQLQPVPDNRNPLYVTEGNPDLQPSFHHSIRINARQTKGTSFWHASLAAATVICQIINETFFDEYGRRVSRPLNVNGNYNLTWNLQYSKSLKRRNFSFRLNLGARGNYTHNTTFTNKIKNEANLYGISPTVSLNLTYKDIFSVQPSFNMRYQFAKYSLPTINDVQYNTKRLRMTMFWNYPKRLIIENSLLYTYNSRTAPGFRKGVTMWSAALNWQVFARQQGTIRLAVYDILKQNLGIYRHITEYYVEDSQSQVLQQYFLASFIYNLRRY
jgi:hypothetical protein